MLLDCLEHTPEVLSAKPPVCTTKISAESEHSDESDWSDMEWTKAGVKLTRLSESKSLMSDESDWSDMEWTKAGVNLPRLSESESLSDSDLGVEEDSSKPKKTKYQ